MATFSEYSDYDGLGLAALVKRGDVAPRELVEAAYAAIDRVNPKINAVIAPMREHAEQTLRRGVPNGPFQGVPFLAKDLLISYAGIPTGGASRLTQGFIRHWDSEIVKRFKKAGLACGSGLGGRTARAPGPAHLVSCLGGACVIATALPGTSLRRCRLQRFARRRRLTVHRPGPTAPGSRHDTKRSESNDMRTTYDRQ